MSLDRKASITDEITDLDRRLLLLVAQRTRLLTKAATMRRTKGKGAVDPAQERQLRTAWDDAAAQSGLSRASLRSMFTMLNGLAYTAADQPEVASRGGQDFSLKPKSGPVHIDAAALPSVYHACLLTALAGALGQPLRLDPVPLCDPIIELIKAFNHLGAKLSWEGQAIVAQEASGTEEAPWSLAYEGGSAFAGNYPLTLYLIIALGLSQAGRTSLSGGVDLKLLDLAAIAPTLTELGARLAPVTPNTRGLPARLEAGGRMAASLTLPDDFPPDFAAALVMAAWSYPEGLTLQYRARSGVAHAVTQAVAMLRQCGVDVALTDDTVRIPHAKPIIPRYPVLPMDTLAAGTLLAMVRLRGGSVSLSGFLPKDGAETQDIVSLLTSTGLQVRTDAGLQATPGDWPRPLNVSMASLRLFPLGVALAASSPHGGTLRLSGDDADMAMIHARELLFAAGKGHRVDGLQLDFEPGFQHEPQGVYVAPGPEWALSLALLALARPGLALDNPGVLTGLWPGFWSMYNRITAPVTGLLPKKDTPADDKPAKTGRRIIVR